MCVSHVGMVEQLTCLLLGAVAKLRKTTINVVVSVCLSVHQSSVCAYGTARLALDGLSGSMVFDYYSKLCQENSSFIAIWQEERVFYMKTNIVCDYISLSSSSNEKCLKQSCRENKNAQFKFIFSPKILPLMAKCGKIWYSQRPQMTI
jgi:hypothetical protein